METYTNPQPGQPMGGRRTGGDGRGSMVRGPVTKRKQWYVQASRTGQPRTRYATHTTGRRWRGTKGQQPRSSSLARVSASATPTPVHQDDSKFFHRRYGATARVRQAQGTQNRPFPDREQAPPWPWHPEPEGDIDRRSHLHITNCDNRNGAHRWQGAAQADQEHLAVRTGYNSLPLRLSRVGRAGTVKPTNRGAKEVPEHIVTKAGTKAKDNPHPLPEGEPLKT